MEADHGMRLFDFREELSIGFRSLREPQHAVVDNLRAVVLYAVTNPLRP